MASAVARGHEAGAPIFSLKNKRVWVAGHRGMVGAAVMRRLDSEGCEILTVTRQQVDLRRQDQVEHWMRKERPQVVFLAAAKVGGILANDTYPAEFLYDNLLIEANVIKAASDAGVEKLLFLGSTCIYPKFAPQPMPEEALLTGPLEPTNEWYAIAKIAGIKLCQAFRREYSRDFISAMPTNLYGPGDNFDPETSHVMAALIRKTHEAKQRGDRILTVWGSGTPRREFLHVDDAADALVFLMKHYSADEHLNVGTGEDLTILELARKIMAVVGYQGELVMDSSKPDGTPRKLVMIDRLRSLGWTPSISLDEGLARTYRWYAQHISSGAS